jgi:hypothetical protein
LVGLVFADGWLNFQELNVGTIDIETIKLAAIMRGYQNTNRKWDFAVMI